MQAGHVGKNDDGPVVVEEGCDLGGVSIYIAAICVIELKLWDD